MRFAVAMLAVALGLGACAAHADDVGRDVERYLGELGAEARKRFEARRPIIRRRMAELQRRGERVRAVDELRDGERLAPLRPFRREDPLPGSSCGSFVCPSQCRE